METAPGERQERQKERGRQNGKENRNNPVCAGCDPSGIFHLPVCWRGQDASGDRLRRGGTGVPGRNGGSGAAGGRNGHG